MPVGPYGALLDAVRGVRWPARRPVAQGAPGVHHARSRGVAPEFAEYRPYRQGDDPKRLDWKLLARSDKAFVRLAPDHAVLGTTLLVDASASMAFPEREPNKWTQAKRLAVGLAAVAHGSGDPVGVTVVSGDGLRRLEPRTRAGVIADIARTLDAVRPSAAPGLADCCLVPQLFNARRFACPLEDYPTLRAIDAACAALPAFQAAEPARQPDAEP